MFAKESKKKKLFPWTDEIVNEMIYLYEIEFWSLTEIGKKFNLNKITINLKLKNNGVILRDSQETRNLQTERRMRSCRGEIVILSENYSVAEISQKVNITESLVRKILKQENIQIRRKSYLNLTGEISSELENKICEKYLTERENLHSLGRFFNLKHWIIRKILIKHGIDIKNRMESNGRRIYFTTEQELEICKLYEMGNGSCSLARQFGSTFEKIKIIVEKHDGIIRGGNGDCGTILSLDDELQICQIYTDGKIGQYKISKMFNISDCRLRDILQKNNIPIRDKDEAAKLVKLNNKPRVEANKRLKEDKREAKKLAKEKLQKERELLIIDAYVNDGLPTHKIKAKFHIAMESIQQIFKKYFVAYKERHFWDYPALGSRGIAGKYKNIQFRSLMELSFIINYLEKKNISVLSGEKLPGIKYFNSQKQSNRKYYPDFITDKYIFEIKPKALWTDVEVVEKANAAKIFAEQYNLKYRLVNFPWMKNSIAEKYELGQLTFTDKNLKRFLKYFKNLTPTNP